MLGQSWSPPGRCHNHSVVAGRYQCRCHAAEYPNQYCAEGYQQFSRPILCTGIPEILFSKSSLLNTNTSACDSTPCMAGRYQCRCHPEYLNNFLPTLRTWIPIAFYRYKVCAAQHQLFSSSTDACNIDTMQLGKNNSIPHRFIPQQF